ncbi:hypothetical protein RhiLY_10667 [Ceratobasidium sp. AG-Ba]|nr:hypothetical protein RhiLY_10667 [Ceratobasidium sp. AG-Ba]
MPDERTRVNMNNQGAVPTTVNESGPNEPSVPSRYVLIHLKDVDWNQIDQGKLNVPLKSIVPIEENQISACLLHGKRLSEYDDVDTIVKAGPYIALTQRILWYHITRLEGWDLVGYCTRSTRPLEVFVVARIWGRKSEDQLFIVRKDGLQ